MNVERGEAEGVSADLHAAELIPCLDIEALWIRSRLGRTAAEVNEALADYRFHEAASLVYQFFWGDFCDWYLEMVKLRLDFSGPLQKAAARAALSSLLATFESSLRLLSPFMPFITEELWHALYDGAPPAKSIALTSFPEATAKDVLIELHMSQLQELITAVRVARKDLGVEERVTVPLRIRAAARLARLFADNRQIIERLGRVSEISFIDTVPQGAGARSAAEFDLQVVYEKQVDVAAERERLAKELARFEKEQTGAEAKLQNEAFLAKAPGPVVDGIRRRAAELVILLEKTRAALAELESH
jgi:valyl-tRNA synthetase